jgi:predicted DNA-binding transcriptional regulator AlpA
MMKCHDINRRCREMTFTNDSVPQERMLPMGQLRRRYNVTDRTIDRWLERGILPSPVRINRVRYWRESDIVQFERALLSTREPNRRVEPKSNSGKTAA